MSSTAQTPPPPPLVNCGRNDSKDGDNASGGSSEGKKSSAGGRSASITSSNHNRARKLPTAIGASAPVFLPKFSQESRNRYRPLHPAEKAAIRAAQQKPHASFNPSSTSPLLH